MNRGAEALLGWKLGVQNREGEQALGEGTEKDRWGRRGRDRVPVYLLPPYQRDFQRGPASSSRKRLISVLRSPVIFIGILLFLLYLLL